MSQTARTETSISFQKEHNHDTDSSLNRSQGPQSDPMTSTKFSKKRVGPYCYRLSDVIGSGFSSTVSKGYKDNDKNQLVAIKVVKLKDMKAHRRQLL